MNLSNIDPATWTQLIVAVATLATALAGWIKSMSNSKKIDQNTDLTKDIHKVTNGPLTNMESNMGKLAIQVETNAAQARSTAEAAKVQAAVDASHKPLPQEQKP
jgi:hypothetical protein